VNVLDDHSNNNNLKIEWKNYERRNPNLHVFIINYKTFDTFPNFTFNLTILYHWLNREHFHVIALDLKCLSSSNFQVPNSTREIT
jgi:hypothetical protein